MKEELNPEQIFKKGYRVGLFAGMVFMALIEFVILALYLIL